MKKSKKAISPIISAVLLISIVLILASIILNFSINYIENQKEDTEGFSYNYDARLNVLMELASSSLSGLGDDEVLILGVRRVDNGNDVLGLRFNFKDNQGNSYSYDDYQNPPNNAGQIYSYEINLEEIEISAWGNINKISVHFLYGNNKATDVLDEIIFE